MLTLKENRKPAETRIHTQSNSTFDLFEDFHLAPEGREDVVNSTMTPLRLLLRGRTVKPHEATRQPHNNTRDTELNRTEARTRLAERLAVAGVGRSGRVATSVGRGRGGSHQIPTTATNKQLAATPSTSIVVFLLLF